ncbi:hypothetical protein UY3_13663 [Chelonia mydas]|uniref:Uncharacterized protein n=1 Tax=Chelonia mydas TaxID=8469 RepID=M7BAP0_CHEMY|nr:hypothetical protein UY3_13663 [Chelonia mydas]
MDSKEEEGSDLNAKEPRDSGDKGGASPEGPRTWSDSPVIQTEGGTGANGKNSTAGPRYASLVSDAGSSTDPEVSGATEVADEAEVEDIGSCFGNIGGAE